MDIINSYSIDTIKSIIKWILKINSNGIKFSKDLINTEDVRLAHLLLLEDFIDKTFTPPKYSHEKGIVIAAGGAKYFGCAFACFNVLRKLGCSLPVEFWYLDEYEMDNGMKNLCNTFGIKYINATKYCETNNLSPRILAGWELKPFSVLHSNFKEVLYLDADNIPAKDPSYLFDLPEYKRLGAIFWPDLPVCPKLHSHRKEWVPPEAWSSVGLDYVKEPDFETGQYLIDKSKCFKELSLTMWINEHSDYFYNLVYGDKSTFHLAWRKCGSDYVIPNKEAGWKHPCILQYDTNNELIFQHACQGKEMIFSGEGPSNQLHYNLVLEAKNVRDKYWSGTIFSWQEMDETERNIAQQYIGKYNYSRINLDSRILELKDNGIIGHGWAKCERRWSVRIIDNIPTIIVIGAAHKDSEIAMFFAKNSGDDKNFYGKWTSFEKCNVILERLL